MMAPTIVLDDGAPELVLGSAGSNRIRSAILQVIVNVLDGGMGAQGGVGGPAVHPRGGGGVDAQAAVDAPRVHLEGGVVYAEPGVEVAGVAEPVSWFRERNLFFGG